LDEIVELQPNPTIIEMHATIPDIKKIEAIAMNIILLEKDHLTLTICCYPFKK
jgi:hypothetical protein